MDNLNFFLYSDCFVDETWTLTHSALQERYLFDRLNNPVIHRFYLKYFIFFKGTTAKKKKTTRRTMRGKQDENIQVFGGHM